MATEEKLRAFAAAPLLGRPGERYSYSSPGYVLLAHIIERATGKPYGAFLDEEIFEPLGMAATFNGHPNGQAGLAVGRHNGTPVPSFDLDTLGLGTGSIWSTVGDPPATSPSTHGSPTMASAWPCSPTKVPPTSTQLSMT